jgi:hypothetical protein
VKKLNPTEMKAKLDILVEFYDKHVLNYYAAKQYYMLKLKSIIGMFVIFSSFKYFFHFAILT